MTATAIFAGTAALAWLGLFRTNRELAQALALAATTVLWAAVVALVIAWS
ncbi:hypothetical protein ACFZDG_18385 [Kitasatospora xanthocidica]